MDVHQEDHTPAINNRLDLETILNSLPEREGRVLRQYFLVGRTQASIGAELGVTGSRVGQIVKKGLNAARKIALVYEIPRKERRRKEREAAWEKREAAWEATRKRWREERERLKAKKRENRKRRRRKKPVIKQKKPVKQKKSTRTEYRQMIRTVLKEL